MGDHAPRMTPTQRLSFGPRRRTGVRVVTLDRSLEGLPLFRLSDSAEDAPVAFSPTEGTRWRVLPPLNDRLPGTFDQDVYVELLRRYVEADAPEDGTIAFTLHAFLHSIGRQVDGRTYEQLRTGLTRLERTTLESTGAYYQAGRGAFMNGRFSILTFVAIERRRAVDRTQLALFDSTMTREPGEARVTIAAAIRENLAARHVITLSMPRYLSLASPVARRLYRLLELARADGHLAWRVPLTRLKDLLPLVQRYPSHLLRVLQPAHDMLVQTGVLRSVAVRQQRREWVVDYVLDKRGEGG